MKLRIEEKIFHITNNVVLFIVSLTCLMPLLYIMATSLSSGNAIDSGKVYFWPVDFNVASYELLLKSTNIIRYFQNSVIVTAIGTLLSIIFTILCAYPLSKKNLYARKTITFFVIFTMLFGGGMIPAFLLVKSLGLIDSYWALWLTALISPYNMMVMKSFFENISDELDDAARIDGCNEVRLLIQIYLPLSKAVIATLCLFYGVSYWNSFLKVLLYINDSNEYTLPVMIQQMVFQLQQIQNTGNNVDAGAINNISMVVSESVKSAGVIVLIVPMLIVYPFLQKYFVKGVMLGSVKG